MKFNKEYKKYAKIYLENAGVLPNEVLEVKQGDQVMFASGWEKHPYMADIVNTSTGERIREMIEQKNDPLIATAIKSVLPAAYGGHGSFRDNVTANEKEFVVTVSQQYALGLYKNVVEVPMCCLKVVDNGNNLPPYSSNQIKDYKKTTGEEPKLNPDTTDPTTMTHASWKDHGGPLPS